MECSVCGSGNELLYTCSRCGKQLCATHQGRTYHDCEPSPEEWVPPGTRDTTADGHLALARLSEEEAAVDRPVGQLFPDEQTADRSGHGDVEHLPPDAARPGYGPGRLRPDPVEPADSIAEWLRRQTYLSLVAKVGFIATLWSALVFSTLAVTLSVAGA